ncbi:MAG: DNA-processing protein DprA [Steroidobacteraceae bacterium]|nr:DNA-processing protein DprA [Steroidobacteraceae bacterium]
MKLSDQEMRGWLALARAPGVDARRARALLERFGSVAAIAGAPAAELAACGLPPAAVAALASPDEAALARDRAWLDADGRGLVVCGSEDFPPLLATLPDAPAALFVQGRVDALHLPQVAIVGSRRPTPAGRALAFAFARELAAAGFAVTSGLAAGIDAAAHRGALAAGGRSIAVCGTGPDLVYPPGHAPLAAELAVSGAVVTEFPTGVPPLPAHFPLRNRIISGLSLGVLVVEAAQRSGSLITARLAAEQGREVFALPGSVANPLARGCHRLIRDGAALVEDVAEIVAALRPAALPAAAARATQPAASVGFSGAPLDRAGKILLNACGFEPVDLDTLVERTGLSAAAVASTLLLLELSGEIESCPGGRYCRVPVRRA